MTTTMIADGAITSNKISLQSGSACLNTDTDVTLAGNLQVTSVPNITLTVTLGQPREVLIWSSGLAHFSVPGYYFGTLIYLDGSELALSASMIPNNGWQPFTIIRRAALSSGTHTLSMRSYGQVAGTETYSGNVCIEYMVLP